MWFVFLMIGLMPFIIVCAFVFFFLYLLRPLNFTSNTTEQEEGKSINPTLLRDFNSALESLGFKKTEIKEIEIQIPDDLKTLEEMVTFALRNYRRY